MSFFSRIAGVLGNIGNDVKQAVVPAVESAASAVGGPVAGGFFQSLRVPQVSNIVKPIAQGVGGATISAASSLLPNQSAGESPAQVAQLRANQGTGAVGSTDLTVGHAASNLDVAKTAVTDRILLGAGPIAKTAQGVALIKTGVDQIKDLPGAISDIKNAPTAADKLTKATELAAGIGTTAFGVKHLATGLVEAAQSPEGQKLIEAYKANPVLAAQQGSTSFFDNLKTPNDVTPPEPTSPQVKTPTVTEPGTAEPAPTEITPSASEGKLAKAVLSKGTLIQHQSPELYNLLDQSVQRTQDLTHQFASSVPTVLEVNKNADLRSNFIDVLRGQAEPVNTKVEQAVKEWTDATQKIHGAATTSGLEVGNRGPNYFPQNIDYEKLTKNTDQLQAAAQHLVDTKQAANTDEAVGLLREAARNQAGVGRGVGLPKSGFGSFNTRSLDLPGFDRGKNVIPSYIEGAARRISQAENLGPNYEKAHALLDQVSAKGGDVKTATEALRQVLNAPQSSSALKQVRGALSAARLGTTAIAHAGQTANTAVESGVVNTLKAHLQNLTGSEKGFLDKLNVKAETNRLRSQEGFEGVAGKFTAPGLKTVMNYNRSVSGIAGKNWADNLAAKGDAKSLKILRDTLGIKGDIVDGKLSEQQQLQAARSLIKHTQFRATPLDTPLGAETTVGKTVGQFRLGFGYKQTGFVYDKILKAAKNGDIQPLIRAGILFPLVGTGVLQAKKAISRAEQIAFDKTIGHPVPAAKADTSSLAEKALAGANQAGAFGIPGEIIKGFSNITTSTGKVDPNKLLIALASTIAPGAGQVADITNRAAQAANGSPQSLERFGLGLTPIVGNQLASATVPYKATGTGGVTSRSKGGSVRTSSSRGHSTRARSVKGTRARRGSTSKVRSSKSVTRFAKVLTSRRA